MREPLLSWVTAQVVADDMLWKGSWGRQIEFVRDQVVGLVGADLDYEDRKNIAWVISTHRSPGRRCALAADGCREACPSAPVWALTTARIPP